MYKSRPCGEGKKLAALFLTRGGDRINQGKGGSQMNTRKVQDFVVKGKEVFVGLEDSKKTWKLAVRCDK
jgi:hypothetical protein